MNKSTIFIIIGTAIGIIFILPLFLFGTLNVGNIFGLFISAGLISYGYFFKKVNVFILNFWRMLPGKILLSFLCLIILTALTFTAVTTAKMIDAANNPPPENATVIVLGCKVNKDVPGLMLTTRLKATLNYLNDNVDAVCYLSGGQGKDEKISEAQAMKNWLVDHGISEERLHLEEKSTSTSENIRFSKELIEKDSLPENIVIITNEFHQYRAKKIAESNYMETYSISAKTPLYLLPTYYLRELAGILLEELNI